ncbi:MAG: SNF2-related protein [Limnochordia bacterium]
MLDPSLIIIPLLKSPGQSLTETEESFYEPFHLKHFSVEFSRSGFSRIIRELRKGNYDDLCWHRLAQQADQLSLTQGFSELMCVNHLAQHWQQVGVIPYPHQVKTAEKVIKEMRGLAILADEVGLGKTIEAGMILKEYLIRGLVKRALILVPSSLCWQWYQELAEKFQIYAGIQRSEWDWEHADILIASIDTAKLEPHAEIIRNINYDMVIIDEAHKLKNTATKAWQLVNSLQKKYCLMLTATPVQNNLKELYNLITLLKPGQLGSYRTFKQKFMQDLRTPKNPSQLRQLLSEVLIRNRRGEGTVQFTKRHVYPIVVELTPPERALYDQITELIRASSKLAPFKANILPLITLQREVCSSFYAAGVTLQKIYDKYGLDPDAKIMDVMNEAVKIRQNSKCDIIEKVVSQIRDRVIIFTEYKASQEYIRYRLEKANFRTFAFDGSLSRGRKQWVRYLFQKEGGILVSTESGGEGLNFQFCNHVINYDLPWNPMRLEQRIGRVHRLGQTKDVHVYNLVTKDTIEEHIMFLLHEKINMFQMILGELDAILMHLKWDKSFESQLMQIFLKAASKEAVQRELDQLGDEILKAREEIRRRQWDFF